MPRFCAGTKRIEFLRPINLVIFSNLARFAHIFGLEKVDGPLGIPGCLIISHEVYFTGFVKFDDKLNFLSLFHS